MKTTMLFCGGVKNGRQNKGVIVPSARRAIGWNVLTTRFAFAASGPVLSLSRHPSATETEAATLRLHDCRKNAWNLDSLCAFALCLACVGALAQTDVRGPIPVSANSPDGWIIGVCFDKPLSEASATNLANYSLSEPGYAITSAVLRADLQSVTLRLESRYSDPFRVPQFWVTNIAGLDGLSTPWTNYIYVRDFTATDVGSLGTDPKIPGSFFTCRFNEFEIVSNGSGWEGTNDGFYLVHQRFNPGWDLYHLWRVSSLEAANKDSTVGLMIREDLSPGSRFVSVSVTSADEAARDGSGPGSALVKVLYRGQPGEVPTEVSGTRSIKGLPLTNLFFQFSRVQKKADAGWEKKLFVNWISPSGGTVEVLAEVTFPVPLTENWRLGLAAASHNNDMVFSSRSVSWVGVSYFDPAPPTLTFSRAGTDATLSWCEIDGPSWRLVSQPKLDRLASWDWVTNAVVRVPGALEIPKYFTNFVTVHRDGDIRFFKLLSR